MDDVAGEYMREHTTLLDCRALKHPRWNFPHLLEGMLSS